MILFNWNPYYLTEHNIAGFDKVKIVTNMNCAWLVTNSEIRRTICCGQDLISSIIESQGILSQN